MTNNKLIVITLIISSILSSCEQVPDISHDNEEEYYKSVKIGTQIWRVLNNYDYSHFNPGGFLYLQEDSAWSIVKNNYDIKAYCNSNTEYFYGSYYTYSAAKEACPEGWHLPSMNEWRILYDFVQKSGYKRIERNALAATGGWDVGYVNFDVYQFSALPSGYRTAEIGPGEISTFLYEGRFSSFWTSTEKNDSMAYRFTLRNGEPYINEKPKYHGIPIRCVKD